MVRFIHVLKYQIKIANLVGGIKGTIVLLTLTWIGGWYLEDFLVILCILKKWFLYPINFIHGSRKTNYISEVFG